MATKHQKLWKDARDEWIANNPPSHEGYWYCTVGGGHLTLDTLTLTTTSLDQEIPKDATIRLTYIPCAISTTEKKAVAVLNSIEIVNRPSDVVIN